MSDDEAPRRRKKSKFSDAPAPHEQFQNSASVAAALGGPPPAAPADALISSFLDDIAKGAPAAPPPPPAQGQGMKPAPAMYFDVVRGGTEPDAGDLLGRLDLTGASQLTFGRDQSRVDIPLDHGSVSRHHATMTFDGATAYISDIRSTHGTFVMARGGEEQKISELTRLEAGDYVRFGESSRRYVFGRGAAAAPRVAAPVLPQDITLALKIAETSVPRLTGLSGKTLAQVRDRTGCQLRVMPKPHPDDLDARGIRIVELRGSVEAVAGARLELLAICSTGGAQHATFDAAGAAAGGQRFRYASTVISARGDDDDLYDGGQFGKPGKI